MVLIFTATFGGYDVLDEPEGLDGVRYICYTDLPQKTEGWEYIIVGDGYLAEEAERRRDALAYRWYYGFQDLSPVMAARRVKVLAHLALPRETEISLWHDGNLRLRGDPRVMAESFLKNHDLALFGHPTRDCIYKEAAACLSEGKGDPGRIWDQVEDYKKQGYPPNRGLVETGVILRRHTNIIKELEREWWSEVVVGSTRDQISLPFVLWKWSVDFALMPGAVHSTPAVEYSNVHGQGG